MIHNILSNVQLVMWQDVVDIMKESLYDKYVDEHGFVDFTRSGGMSQPKQAKKFLNALNKESELQQKDCFSRTVSDVANLLLS
jgi:DNA helicase MCM8